MIENGHPEHRQEKQGHNRHRDWAARFDIVELEPGETWEAQP